VIYPEIVEEATRTFQHRAKDAFNEFACAFAVEVAMWQFFSRFRVDQTASVSYLFGSTSEIWSIGKLAILISEGRTGDGAEKDQHCRHARGDRRPADLRFWYALP
jgi:hypothetical protein